MLTSRPTSVEHVAVELWPQQARGGLGMAVGRLVEQLADAGARSRVLMPSGSLAVGEHPTAWGTIVALPIASRGAERIAAYSELAGAAHAPGSLLVCHDHEAAAAALLARHRHSDARIVVWLHSLYDTPHPSELPPALRELSRPDSLTAGALEIADLIVTSAGILADARELDWPPRMQATRAALLRAAERGQVCLVEADQCLPSTPSPIDAPASERPRLLFAARPGVHKGAGIFLAIVERLAALDVEFVALGDPLAAGLDPRDPTVARVRWLPWLSPDQFYPLLRSSTCALLPSLSEGFGLVAAEADALGVPLLYNDIGGLRSLP
ncbi:MAG TPA: glycosyltransferase, partial [Enhygromyxa sp.]|nr:glycosyltransferase [Enhygromyxa sp.]